MKHFKSVLKSKKGQGVMEYVILSTLIGVVCLVAIKSFGSTIHTRVKFMEKQVTEHIKLK